MPLSDKPSCLVSIFEGQYMIRRLETECGPRLAILRFRVSKQLLRIFILFINTNFCDTNVSHFPVQISTLPVCVYRIMDVKFVDAATVHRELYHALPFAPQGYYAW